LIDRAPIGVIDIGSNSVRLVVYEGLVRSPAPLFNEKTLCGLGRSVASKGELGKEARTLALVSIQRFRAIADVLHVEDLHVIATAAVREARDGPDFIAECESICRCRVTVLTGPQEAELAAAGIMMGFQEPDGFAGDLGGGSLELIDVRNTTLRGATTLPLGGLRLIDTARGDRDKAREIVQRAIEGVDWTGRGRDRPFFAVGGTWRALSRLHMAEVGYPLRVTHGYRIKTGTAIEFCDKIARARRTASITGIDDVSSARREVLPFGAIVLETLLRQIKPSEVVISVFGIREGLLYRLLPQDERAKDPLLAFCRDYAKLRSRSPLHAQELCDWTDMLVTCTGLEESREDRRLRHAACLLSDSNWRAESDYRGELSLGTIARSAATGTDHPGRAFLALAVYFRHTNHEMDDFGQRLTGLLPKRAVKRARIVGSAIRAAHMVSIGTHGVIPKTRLYCTGSRLFLALPRALQPLDGDRLRRRFETLANLLDRQGQIDFVD
jgi:exopolyphosphatase/guanosine-5'-triphosphate,3'-diphosphate pyrophosphatase